MPATATSSQLILDEPSRAKLDGIVGKMHDNKESDDDIKFVVEDFKKKYSKPAIPEIAPQQQAAPIEGQPPLPQPTINAAPALSQGQSTTSTQGVATPKISAPIVKKTPVSISPIKEGTRKQFETNPVFSSENPNAEKNRESYYNGLRKAGYSGEQVDNIKDYGDKVVVAKTAIPILEERIKENPADKESYYALGKIQSGIGDYDKAIKSIESSMGEESQINAPENSHKLYEIASIYSQKGDSKTAIDYLKKSIKANPETSNEAFTALASFANKSGDTQSAEEMQQAAGQILLNRQKETQNNQNQIQTDVTQKSPDANLISKRLHDASVITHLAWTDKLGNAVESAGEGLQQGLSKAIKPVLDIAVPVVVDYIPNTIEMVKSAAQKLNDAERGFSMNPETGQIEILDNKTKLLKELNGLATAGIAVARVVEAPALFLFDTAIKTGEIYLPSTAMELFSQPGTFLWDAISPNENKSSFRQEAEAALDLIGNLVILHGIKKGIGEKKIDQKAIDEANSRKDIYDLADAKAQEIADKFRSNEPLDSEQAQFVVDAVKDATAETISKASEVAVNSGDVVEVKHLDQEHKTFEEQKKTWQSVLSDQKSTPELKQLATKEIEGLDKKIAGKEATMDENRASEAAKQAQISDIESQIDGLKSGLESPHEVVRQAAEAKTVELKSELDKLKPVAEVEAQKEYRTSTDNTGKVTYFEKDLKTGDEIVITKEEYDRSNPLKPQENATQKGEIQTGNQPEHRGINAEPLPESTGGSNRLQQGGEKPKEEKPLDKSVVRTESGDLKPVFRSFIEGDQDYQGELGTHFGSSEAAAQRGEALVSLAKDSGKEVISEKVNLNIHNPLKISEDIGFKDYETVVNYLRDKDIISDAEKGKLDENKSFSDVKKMLQDKGYDGIEYVNKVEDSGSKSYIVFDQKDIIRESLSNEQKVQLTKDEVKSLIENREKPPMKERLTKAITDSKIWKAGEELVKAFHPFVGEGKELARDTAILIRKRKGEETRQLAIQNEASKKLLDFWNKVPSVDKHAFILSIENPKKYGTPTGEFNKLSESYRKRLDDAFDVISKIKDVPYTEDYFPHFWKDPKKAKSVIGKTMSKAPLEGSKSFLKQRFHEDILSGLKAGLELATDNPEEMVRLAEINAWKFKTAHDIFSDIKESGLAKYFDDPKKVPEGYVLVQDPLFDKMFGKGFYMPEPVARIVENYLSRGLFGREGVVGNVSDAVRNFNNTLNQWQLGLGLFHFTTTAIDATVSGMSRGLRKISTLNPSNIKSGAADIVKSFTIVPNLVETVRKGAEARRNLKGGLFDKEVESLITANAKTGLSKMYSVDASYNFRKALDKVRFDKDLSQVPKVIWHGINLIPEIFSKPLMESWVPNLKVGGYLKAVENELSLRKDLTPREIDIAKQKAWDDMDNRLGQMVYDNIFWNKVVKDLGFLSIRSLGWTGGTIRAIGGGIGEIPKSIKQAAKGEGITDRTAWMIALPMTVGTMGAMFQYMMTGKSPDSTEDYFYPKDGTLNPDGTPHRISFPSYMKDLYAYGKQPLKTAGHKASPWISNVIELLNNKDFYGTEIYNEEDPSYQKGIDILKHEAESFTPFAFRQKQGEEKTLLQQVSTQQGIEQKLGFMPAPREFDRTDTQNLIVQESSKSFGDKAKTKEQAEKITARRIIRERMFHGEKYSQIPAELKKVGGMTETEIDEGADNPYDRMFKYLSSESQLKVISKMDEKERAHYKEHLNDIGSFESLIEKKPHLLEDDQELKSAYDYILKQSE